MSDDLKVALRRALDERNTEIATLRAELAAAKKARAATAAELETARAALRNVRRNPGHVGTYGEEGTGCACDTCASVRAALPGDVPGGK